MMNIGLDIYYILSLESLSCFDYKKTKSIIVLYTCYYSDHIRSKFVTRFRELVHNFYNNYYHSLSFYQLIKFAQCMKLAVRPLKCSTETDRDVEYQANTVCKNEPLCNS